MIRKETGKKHTPSLIHFCTPRRNSNKQYIFTFAHTPTRLLQLRTRQIAASPGLDFERRGLPLAQQLLLLVSFPRTLLLLISFFRTILC
jgi:hypothetical protein